MNDLIQIFIPTSVAPYHPSTEIVEQTVSSVWDMLGTRTPPTFYCDAVPPWITAEERINYEEYLTRLCQLDIGRLIYAPEWVGLVGLFKMFIKDIQTPLILNMQHDWVFVDSERIRTKDLIQAMLKYPQLQTVRFTKRPLPYSRSRRRFVDYRAKEVDPEKYGIPLMATGGWGDSPHFSRAEFYTGTLSELMDSDHGPDGRYGIEGPVYRYYRNLLKKQGFDKAQSKMGSFLYGQYHEQGYIRHLGYKSKTWRRRKGIRSKR